jgi:NAD(P)-dependent dehydrogenase (short-subunit alcohol dehydrogenase family)
MKKVMIVTGGSRGIGAAAALLAADRGYNVCINYLHQQEAANQVVDAIEQMVRRAIAVAADISLEPDVIHLFNQVDEQLGCITALVNNAGILAPQMRLETMTTARLSQVFATNILGSFLCAREAVKRRIVHYEHLHYSSYSNGINFCSINRWGKKANL